MNPPTDVPVTPLAVTDTSTAPAAWAGVVTVICVAELPTKAAGFPPMVTAVALPRSVPVRTTDVPPAVVPELGAIDVITGVPGGGGVTNVNAPVSVGLPFGVLTVTSAAPAAWIGVTAVTVVAETLTVGTSVPPNTTPVAPVRPEPVMVTVGAASGRATGRAGGHQRGDDRRGTDQAGRGEVTIGEPQRLDVADNVRAVGTDDRELRSRTGDGVGGGVAREDRHVGTGSTGVGDDRLDREHVGRVDLAGQNPCVGRHAAQQRGQARHERATRGVVTGTGVRLRRTVRNRQSHREVGVAVQQVIATATLQQVAAGATDEDVAVVPAGCRRRAEQAGQAVDARHVASRHAVGDGRA